MSSLRLLLGFIVAVLSFSTMASPIRYQRKNIDWGEKEVLSTARTRTGKTLQSVGAVGGTIETRVIRLQSGHRLRIRERIEVNAAGGEDRIYVGGEKIDEVRIVADPDNVEQVLAALQTVRAVVVARYGRFGQIIRARLPEWDDDERSRAMNHIASCGGAGQIKTALSQMKFYEALGERTITPAANPNDPVFPQEWHLGRVGVTNVWAMGYYGYPNIKCAVFDTGVHLTHEDLQINVNTRVSALKSSADPEDHHGHGSHCLGIMGADANNGLGVVGVGQVANLTSIRGPISYGTAEDDILDGFQYALDHNIRVLSCSFGSPAGTAYYDEAEHEMIEELRRNGCLVVIAAGNDGNDNDRVPGYPSSYDNDNIITVVASNKRDALVNAKEDGWDSCYGATTCDIAAPGTDIISCTKESNSAYESWEGTSMATPIVSACAAMVWEQNPSWTYREIKDRLFATATPVAALVGTCSTGARVDLAAAMNQRYTLLADPLAQKAYEVGEAVRVTFRVSEGVSSVRVTLNKRDDESFAQDLGEFEVSTGENTIVAWVPEADDVSRGYTFRIEGVGDAAEAHAYTSMFRVKEAGITEIITVTSPGEGTHHDAASFKVAFTPYSAIYADLAIEQQQEDGSWELDTTLGMVACKPGESNVSTIELKGRGWVSERPYRIVVSDNDDPSVFGVSPSFYFDQSSLSVYLLPGNADAANPGMSDATWPEAWEVGCELRISCRLPQTDLYWLLLIEESSGNAIILKETWTDITDPLFKSGEFHRFGLTIPEAVGMTNDVGQANHFFLRLVDAFDMTMYQDSPLFTLAPRTDGFAEPTPAQALGDETGREFTCNGQWYPERTDAGWRLRCGYVGPNESAAFETDVSGPVTVTFDCGGQGDFPGELKLEYAKAPILKSTVWTAVGSDGYVPAGDWKLRWTFIRTDTRLNTEEELGLWLKNLDFGVTMPAVSISTKNGILRITGTAWPTNILYTIDGSKPDVNSPHWVDGMNLDPYRFTLDRSLHIHAKAYREGTVPGRLAEAFYFHSRGAGTEADPIRIETPTDLQCFAESVLAGSSYAGKVVRVMNDLDMAGHPMRAIGWEGSYLDNDGYYRVMSRVFSGIFDGGNQTIANLTIKTTTLSGADGVKGFFGMIDPDATIQNLTLAAANAPLIGFAEEGLSPRVENCEVVSDVGSDFTPLTETSPDYRDYGRPTAIEPLVLSEGGMPYWNGGETALNNPLEQTFDCRAAREDDWVFRYTTDGSEPNETSPISSGAEIIPGGCTLKVRASCEPWYEPGPVLTHVFVPDWNEKTLASQTMTLSDCRVLNSAANYTENFIIAANPAEIGFKFSHWKVTGPVAITDYQVNPLSFQLMTKEAVSFAPVYALAEPELMSLDLAAGAVITNAVIGKTYGWQKTMSLTDLFRDDDDTKITATNHVIQLKLPPREGTSGFYRVKIFDP